METKARQVSSTACAVLIAVAFMMNCTGGSGTYRGLTREGPSRWRGEIQGRVSDRPFRLPMVIEFKEPLPQEDNPVGVFINAGDPSQVGNLALASARQYSAPSGGRITLQYFSLKGRGSQLRGVLADEHVGEAAAYNQFVSPNVTAQNAPPGPAQHLQQYLPPTEICAFRRGAVLTINLSGERLTGNIEGSGHSVTGIFPGDVSYRAEFVAARVR